MINMDECKNIIKSIGFEIDDKNKNINKKFRTVMSSLFSKYQTPAEEEIDYLGEHYFKKNLKELEEDNHQCLKYLNILRISYNNSIKGLKQISLEFED